MTGSVDGAGRALLRLRLRHPDSEAEMEVDTCAKTLSVV